MDEGIGPKLNIAREKRVSKINLEAHLNFMNWQLIRKSYMVRL